ncbi:pirin family protein [Ramlibacter albus]|uniref:pirin family protein n=1 Tax=Ramlibacter albus TaxID=2079448 RepID=UPI00338FC23A
MQLISSGTGIRHSERNPHPQEPTHLFQIWLHGNADAEPPRYQYARGALDPVAGSAMRAVASGDEDTSGLH